jgi:hypothetical protein
MKIITKGMSSIDKQQKKIFQIACTCHGNHNIDVSFFTERKRKKKWKKYQFSLNRNYIQFLFARLLNVIN